MPDLILCDFNMRDMSGFNVLEHLTAIAPHFSNMPFVFLTALTDRNSELKGRRLGADDYVTKPIDFDILATIIAARLAPIARTDVWVRNLELNDREIEALTWVAPVRRRRRSQKFST
jgi:DNA-binding response OmpR family regulator